MTACRLVVIAAVLAACEGRDAPAPVPAPASAPTALMRHGDAAAPQAPLEITAGNPVLVATTSERWADGLPFDEPVFALYDNGAMLCMDRTGRHAAMLTPAERDELIRSFEVPLLVRAAGHYQAVEATDQRSSDLYVWRSGCRARIDVWGEILKADDFTDDVKTSTLPALILFAWKRIQAYPCGAAAPWKFPGVEAIVSPDTRPITATWPDTWPTVSHERPSGDEAVENVIQLPAQAYDQLHAMSLGRVQIATQAYFVRVHVPWPHEDQWRGRPPRACGPEPRRN
jgi:hypothetical protein